MRQPSEKAEAVRKAMRLGVVDEVGVKILASSEADAREWEKTLSGEKMTIARALAAFGSAYQEFRALHPDAALHWGAGVLDAMGFDREVLSRAVPIPGTAEPAIEVPQAVTSAAHLLDLHLHHAPIEEQLAAACDAEREVVEAKRSLQQAIPQGALALGVRP